MRIPPSPHFTSISLATAFNADRAQLEGGLAPYGGATPSWSQTEAFGDQTYHGIPFRLGQPNEKNVILLSRTAGDDGVRVDFDPIQATYLVVMHAVEDRAESELPALAPLGPVFRGGHDNVNDAGGKVAAYVLEVHDGSQIATPILRRFAIQQRRITWGASPFAALPAWG